jgi:RHS repeat-associated protein
VHTDHLGSIDALTDAQGNVTERVSFDAFGRRRQANWADGSATTDTTRGYTGHEMDDELALINMNAREYDPIIGRFLTPDTLVDGGFSQGLNRYSYVKNNPLAFTDPTGHLSLRRVARWVGTAIVYDQVARTIIGAHAFAGFVASGGNPAGAIAGGIAGVQATYSTYRAYRKGADFGDMVGLNTRSLFFTSVSGVAYNGVGTALGADPGWYARVPAHAITGGALSTFAGGDFKTGAWAGGVGAAAGDPFKGHFFYSTIYRAAVGAIAARIVDGDVGQGAVIAAVAYAFNECFHNPLCVRALGEGGEVIKSGPDPFGRGGNRVMLRDANGTIVKYYHLDGLELPWVGDYIEAGGEIADICTTPGKCGTDWKGPHVHVERWENDVNTNPGTVSPLMGGGPPSQPYNWPTHPGTDFPPSAPSASRWDDLIKKLF